MYKACRLIKSGNSYIKDDPYDATDLTDYGSLYQTVSTYARHSDGKITNEIDGKIKGGKRGFVVKFGSEYEMIWE